MELEKSIFREYDIRGIVGRELNNGVLGLLGRAFGTFVRKAGSRDVVVGFDNRESSKDFCTAFIEGLKSTGCHAINIGMVVTPMLYFARKKWKLNAGAMITASHNPSEYNGVKLVFGSGCIFGEQIQEIKKLAESKNFLQGNGSLRKKDVVAQYEKEIVKKINLKKTLKVVLDCGNGTASPFASNLFRKLGCEVIEIFCDSDPSFPNHFPDPTVPAFLKTLVQKVVQEKADLGVALDGDADRIGVVDDKGNVLFGDQLMTLFSREILKEHLGAKIIVEVKCSQSLIDDIKQNGGAVLMSATGHSIIEERMHREKALFAGEMSGHIYFGDKYYSYDDALYAASRLFELLSKSKEKLSKMLLSAPKYFNTSEIRIDCPEGEKEEIVEKTRVFFVSKYPKSITIDGVRVVFKDGWALIRKSNTQPKLILRFESKTKGGLERIKDEVLQKLRGFESLQDLKI